MPQGAGLPIRICTARKNRAKVQNKTSRSQEPIIFMRMMFMVLESPNAKVSDGSQPPMTFDLSLS